MYNINGNLINMPTKQIIKRSGCSFNELENGAFKRGRIVGGRFQREGTYVYLWLIHEDVWKKPTQNCKAIIFQLKINLKVKLN